MNERIKQLAESSKEYASIEYAKRKTGYDKQYFFETKFAELIVKECAGIAYEYDAPKMSGPGMIIAGRIETHFGVEE